MLGFSSLAVLLLISGIISYFELKSLSHTTKSVLEVSVKNMELSKSMLDAVQDQNTALLQAIVTGTSNSDSLLQIGRTRFDDALGRANVMIHDLPGLDSIYTAYMRYTIIVNQHINDKGTQENITWFVDTYKTSYTELTSSIKNFMISTQNLMDSRTQQLENNAYRAIMPSIIALAIAIIIILIFFYFMDIYYIKPVLRITKGLHMYINSKVPFKVEMVGRDEVYKLKEYIETLITQLKNKKPE